MDLVRLLLGWLFPILAAIGLALAYGAGRNMARTVTDPFTEFNFRMGLFGDRSLFTERGWRFRNLALRAWIAAVGAMVVWFFV
jgi:hypothetical protein